MRSKLCAFDNKRFLPSSPQQRYCSASCRNKMAYRKAKAKRELREKQEDPSYVETYFANEELRGSRIVRLISLGEKTAQVDYHGKLFVIGREKIRGIVHEGQIIPGEFS